MEKVKKVVVSIGLSALLLGAVLAAFSHQGMKASAAELEQAEEAIVEESVSDSSAEPYGLYTKISITLSADSTYVYATAKNEFTLFMATIHVYAELYSFDRYQTTYTEDDLEARSYIVDLDQGKTLEARAEIGGRSRYWLAVARYQMDGGEWVTIKTDASLI